jgi:arabinogalactan oligomer/maltooligosaccharide transport system permease protein
MTGYTKLLRIGACLGLLPLLSVAFAQIDRSRFLVIPYGWLRLLVGFVIVAGVIVLAAYLYGRATRPNKAGSYALTAVSHLFIWMFILLTLYPVINVLAVSFNRVNNLNTPPPREGSLLVRAGILPDPSGFSLSQYRSVLSDTNLFWYQWLLVGLLVVAGLVLIGAVWANRLNPGSRAVERLRTAAVWTLVGSAVALVLSINNSQFFSVNEAGERNPSSSEKKVVLFIRNTLLVSGLTGLFAVVISTTAGYAFARMKFDGRYSTLLGFIFVQMFPGFMALVAIFYLMNYLGLLNTFAGLILAYSGGAIAFASWIFKGYLESISPSLEEAALVDGTTRWGAFWRIILPISVPMLLFIFLLQFIGTYSEFILANILLTGDDKWTVGIGLRAFTNNAFQTQWGTLAASAVLGSLPILIIFYSFQNALTGQYTAGGVKG